MLRCRQQSGEFITLFSAGLLPRTGGEVPSGADPGPLPGRLRPLPRPHQLDRPPRHGKDLLGHAERQGRRSDKFKFIVFPFVGEGGVVVSPFNPPPGSAGKEKVLPPKEREKAEREEERLVLNKLSHERKEEKETLLFTGGRAAFPILQRKTARTFISSKIS